MLIYKIKGVLEEKNPGYAIVDTGNISFECLISVNCYTKLPNIGERVELFTHLVIKEDFTAIYGFSSMEEKRFFHLLNKVSKIGPKLAISILSGVSPTELKNAILNNDLLKLSSVPGIGRKTAERIVLELKDSFKNEAIEEVYTVSSGIVEDILSALVNLGYKKNECIEAVKKIPQELLTFEKGFKEALKILSK